MFLCTSNLLIVTFLLVTHDLTSGSQTILDNDSHLQRCCDGTTNGSSRKMAENCRKMHAIHS